MKNNIQSDTDKKKKIKLNKKSKIAVIILLVIAILGSAVALIAVNKTVIYNNAVYMLMPKKLDLNDYDKSLNLVLYSQKNEEYDAKKDEKEPLKAFKYYYYNDKGEKVILNYDDPIYEGTDNEMMVCAQFYYEVLKKVSAIKNALKIAVPIAVVVLVVAGIVIWFISWSKKYDKEKERLKQNQSKSKKKK